MGACMLLFTAFRVCLGRMHAHSAGISSWVSSPMISWCPSAHKPYKGQRSIYATHLWLGSWVSAPFNILYEDDGCIRICSRICNRICNRICIRIRVMRLMSDRAYAYAYGSLYIYGPLILEIVNQQVKEASKVTTLDVKGASDCT